METAQTVRQALKNESTLHPAIARVLSNCNSSVHGYSQHLEPQLTQNDKKQHGLLLAHTSGVR